MATTCTVPLCNQLKALSEDPEAFAAEFNAWKAQGSKGEYESFLFGKDSAYVRPEVDGEQYQLRHVHLVPIKDLQKLTIWEKLWKRRTRKTSDRVLVYTSNTRGNHLLIFILDEPTAHDIAKMKSTEDKQLMERLAAVAAAFLYDGSVIA